MIYVEVAEFTFITNHPDLSDPKRPWPADDAEAVEVAAVVVDYFEQKLTRHFPNGEFVILRVEYSFSCLFTTIALGVATIGATAVAAKKVLDLGKSYEKNRPGLVLLAQDLRNATNKVVHSGRKLGTWVYRVTIKDEDVIDVEARQIEAKPTPPQLPSKVPRRKKSKPSTEDKNDA